MNLFQISIVLSILANIALGMGVFLAQPRRKINQAFLLLVVVSTTWLCCLGWGSDVQTVEAARFWIQQATAASAFIPFSVYMLYRAVRLAGGKWESRGRGSVAWLMAALLAAAICQTSWFLRDARLPEKGMTVAVPVYGGGFFAFEALFIGGVLLLVFLFFRALRASQGITRAELQFVMLGWSAATAFGLLCLWIPKLTGLNEIGMFMPLSVAVLDGVTAYGIATRRILDMPQVLSRVSAYVLLTGYLSLIYFAVWYPTTYVIDMTVQTSLALPRLLATVAVVLSVVPAHGWMQRFANRLFGASRIFNPATFVSSGLRALSTLSTTDELLAQFGNVACDGVGTDRAIILLRDGPVFRQMYPPSENPLLFPADDALIAQMHERHEPLAADLLPRYAPTPFLADAARRLAELHLSVAVGIRAKDHIEGVLLLGPRHGRRIYGYVEIEAIQTLADHLAVALENAKLYTQAQDTAIYTNNLLEHLVSGVIAAGPDQHITVFNREAQRVTGLTPADVMGQPIDKLPAPLAAELREVFGAGTGPREKELTLNSDTRENQLTIRAGSTLFHGSKGQLLGALLVFHDVSAVKRLESQVRRGDRLASMGTLAAGMAHEIKNPLQTLKTFTQLLGDRYDDPEFRGSFTDLVGSEVQRIDALVNQLLRFARPAKPVLVPIHLHSVIENTLRLLQQQMKQHKIAAAVRLDAPSDFIRGDADLLHQAMINFILNAVEAMPTGGSLTFHTEIIGDTADAPRSVESTESWLRLSITDTGTGIAPDILPHIFDPFYTTKNTGTGLGLSVSHGIITEHGGLIDVGSVPGFGTTFHLLFPLCHEEVAA